VSSKVEPKAEAPKAPAAGVGRYTVQVSAWTSAADAQRAVDRLKQAGFDAYVVEAFVKGRTWYRVRVGRFASTAEAQETIAKLHEVQENGVWITKFE
jgi:cell division protein FtsN